MIHLRGAGARVLAGLTDSPVVLIHGPRQCGKTTLAQAIGDGEGRSYLTFDDASTRDAAMTDPTGFIDRLPGKVTLDEIQRVPELFTSIKLVVDRDRAPGRFLLTGSANVLTLPRLSDSLAGRMSIQRLHPLSQAELNAVEPRFIDLLLEGRFPQDARPRLGRELAERVVRGGYPAALARHDPARAREWYLDYVETIVQRDVRDLARITSSATMPRLLQLASSQTARLLNVSALASSFQLSRPTIQHHLVLLERIFQLDRLEPWHRNRLHRLVHTPKLHIGDTGIATALLGLDANSLESDRDLLGHLLESFVYQELSRQASARPDRIRFYHYREKDDYEVDIVIESGDRIAGLEVKTGASVRSEDFRGLRRLATHCGGRLTAGVVLYDGERALGFGDRLFAVPIRSIWETK